MGTVFVLYINDSLVAPCLQLIRHVCEPGSTARPHVTVRGPIKRVVHIREFYRTMKIGSIDFIQPGIFKPSSSETSGKYTVYLRCDSQELNGVSYKPEYPDSVLHITLYDGASRSFATDLFGLLNSYDWRFTVRLPKNSTLSEIRLKHRRAKATDVPVSYDPKLAELFREITSEKLEYARLVRISASKRLELVEVLCSHLFGNAQTLKRHSRPRQEFDIVPPKGKQAKNRLGQYITPPELALQIAEYAKSMMRNSSALLRFGDPAIGTGTFFSAICQVFPPEVIESAIGVEIDKNRALRTQRLWEARGLEVRNRDFFKLDLDSDRNLILCNPPYVRHHHIALKRKTRLQSRVVKDLGLGVSGLAGLYVYFVLVAHRWMKADALGVWILPSEFMSTNYGEVLRKYLTERVELIRVHSYNPKETQFEDALVSPTVVVFRNTRPKKDLVSEFTSGGSLTRPTLTRQVRCRQLPWKNRWTSEGSTILGNASAAVTLEDYFDIKRGLASGADDFFVVERGIARDLRLPAEFLRPILPGPRNLLVDVVPGDPDGYPSLEKQLCLIDCRLSEAYVKRHFPDLWSYLKTADDAKVRNRYLVRNRNPWYKQENREPSLFLCTYVERGSQGRPPLRFIWNQSSAVASNLYLLLYPKGRIADLMRSDLVFQSEVFEVLRSINEETVTDAARVYGGGLRKLEPSDMRAIPAESLTRLVPYDEQCRSSQGQTELPFA